MEGKKMSNSKIIFCSSLLVVFFINNTFAQNTWSQGTDMTAARSWHVVAGVNGKIYALGGNLSDYSSTEEYDPDTDTWTIKANMPTGRTDFSGCSVNEKIYAIGGWSGGITLSSVEEYDPATDAWTKKSNMPTRRWGHATSTVNGKVYIVGGASGWPVKKMYETMEVYDPMTDTWKTKASIPTPRWGLSCSVVNGKIYAIGGTLRDSTSVSTVEEYDPATDSWTKKTDMPTVRWGFASAAVNGKIYAIGGGDPYPATKVYRIVEQYDPAMDVWTTKTSMPVDRIILAACSVNGKIYACGGEGLGSRDQYAELYIYDTGYITGIENNSVKPVNLDLHQNYPNPFNLFTTISYSLPESDIVTLKLYDLVGQEIKVFVNTFQSAGDHQITWSAEGSPSGIYFYRLQTGAYTKTMKLILQK